VYFDTSYIAKYYLNEPESAKVRQLVQSVDVIHSSLWAYTEFHAVLHRRMREGFITATEVRDLMKDFSEHIEDGVWELAPVTPALLRRTGTLIGAAPRDLFVRAGDALHLATAQEISEQEVWTNDRHMLTAAPYFGVTGRSV
jgi:predicted nucleic acid-binding protein